MEKSDKQDTIVTLLTEISTQLEENLRGQSEVTEILNKIFQLLEERLNSEEE